MLQDVHDLKKDAEERARVVALAKKTDRSKEKGCRFVVGCNACIKSRFACLRKHFLGGTLKQCACFLCTVTPRMEQDVLADEGSDSDPEAGTSTDECAVPDRSQSECKPPRKSECQFGCLLHGLHVLCDYCNNLLAQEITEVLQAISSF